MISFLQNPKLRKWKNEKKNRMLIKNSKKERETANSYYYLQDWNNEKATKYEWYCNTLFNGKAVIIQSSNFKSL